MTYYLYPYLTITFFFFLGSLMYTGHTNPSNKKASSLIITNTLLWPLVVIGFVVWGCIAGIKHYARTFKDNLSQ